MAVRVLAELRRVIKPGGILSITEEFADPDYPLTSGVMRRVEAAGFEFERRFGSFLLYTLNFRRDGGTSAQ
jgi:predicted methyltransferase